MSPRQPLWCCWIEFTCLCCSQCLPLACWPAAGPGCPLHCHLFSWPWSCDFWCRVLLLCLCVEFLHLMNQHSDMYRRTIQCYIWIQYFHFVQDHIKYVKTRAGWLGKCIYLFWAIKINVKLGNFVLPITNCIAFILK